MSAGSLTTHVTGLNSSAQLVLSTVMVPLRCLPLSHRAVQPRTAPTRPLHSSISTIRLHAIPHCTASSSQSPSHAKSQSNNGLLHCLGAASLLRLRLLTCSIRNVLLDTETASSPIVVAILQTNYQNKTDKHPRWHLSAQLAFKTMRETFMVPRTVTCGARSPHH